MRFGSQIFESYSTPEQWLAIVKSKGLRAVYSPVQNASDAGEVRAYIDICKENDLKIAEVGAWGYSLVSKSASQREKAFDFAVKQLTLADKLGAATCVNVSGSRSGLWSGNDRDNFSPETFRMIVETVQRLIDRVQPENTTFSLEAMPWMFPDTLQSYRELYDAIDRKAFAVHYDPVNMICTHRSYWNHGADMAEFIRYFADNIKVVHMKDVHLDSQQNTIITETQPGKGELDYRTLLTELNRLNPDLPVMTEHMDCECDSLNAEKYIRSIAEELNISM